MPVPYPPEATRRLADELERRGFSGNPGALIERLYAPLARRLEGLPRGSIVGIYGAQGSGKSTAAFAVAHLLESAGQRVVVLSLDDLYLPRAEREALAARVHPLFTTRGVPGTHDIALGKRVLRALADAAREAPVELPRFDKAVDDTGASEFVAPAPDLILFEGWCVGCPPEEPAALIEPRNDLERHEDVDGHWRHHVNDALAGPYGELFARIDLQVSLMVPSWEVVRRHRGDQERALRAERGEDAGMSDAELDRFVAHFERLTRHTLEAMPRRTEIVVWLDEARWPSSATGMRLG